MTGKIWSVVAAGLLLSMVLEPSIAHAAVDPTSFEAFYRKPWYLSPGDWALIAASAIIAAAAVFFFAPVASPIVASVGSWIGGMFGFSGIAATNFGLALLGGGSVASGGLGMAGGVALLTAAFTFGTDVVVDYAGGRAIERYQYAEFVTESRGMTTLPLPRNGVGSAAYEKAFKVLERIEEKQPLSGAGNQGVIHEAIQVLESGIAGTSDQSERAHDETALALLLFNTADYRGAAEHARNGYRLAREIRSKPTLPAFLLATSMLAQEQFDYRKVITLFEYSVAREPTNPLTPLLFAVVLDRLSYRINVGSISPRAIDAVAVVARLPNQGDQWVAVQAIVLARYIAHVKLEQQKVESLGRSTNETIRKSPKTLQRIKRALQNYEDLIVNARFVAGGLSAPVAGKTEEQDRWAGRTRQLLTDYWNDRERLAGIVRDLQAYQTKLQNRRESPQQEHSVTGRTKVGSGLLLTALLMAAAFVCGLLVSRRFRSRSKSGA